MYLKSYKRYLSCYPKLIIGNNMSFSVKQCLLDNKLAEKPVNFDKVKRSNIIAFIVILIILTGISILCMHFAGPHFGSMFLLWFSGIAIGLYIMILIQYIK